jgi:hypothetical protein
VPDFGMPCRYMHRPVRRPACRLAVEDVERFGAGMRMLRGYGTWRSTRLVHLQQIIRGLNGGKRPNLGNLRASRRLREHQRGERLESPKKRAGRKRGDLQRG